MTPGNKHACAMSLDNGLLNSEWGDTKYFFIP